MTIAAAKNDSFQTVAGFMPPILPARVGKSPNVTAWAVLGRVPQKWAQRLDMGQRNLRLVCSLPCELLQADFRSVPAAAATL